jgi:ribonuclease HI
MYCSFNSKYNKYNKKIILTFFWFDNSIESINGITFQRDCEEKDLELLHKDFLLYSISQSKKHHKKLTFIVPKIDDNDCFVNMSHIKHHNIVLLTKDTELDAHNKKIIIKEYNQIEYMYKDFMPSLFIIIDKYTFELLNNKEKIKDKSPFSFTDVDKHYIDFTKEPKDDSFFDKYITVFTDAAFDHEKKAYGWGIWIKHKEITERVSGYGFTRDNNHSEMYAIFFAVEKLIEFHEKNIINLNEKIISLTTDSDKCISLLHKLNPKDRFSKSLSEMKSKLNQFSTKYNFELRLKGIKSHLSNKTNNKQAVNNWCDQEAKNQLNIIRKEIANNNLKYLPNSKEEYPKIKRSNNKQKKYHKRKSVKEDKIKK